MVPGTVGRHRPLLRENIPRRRWRTRPLSFLSKLSQESEPFQELLRLGQPGATRPFRIVSPIRPRVFYVLQHLADARLGVPGAPRHALRRQRSQRDREEGEERVLRGHILDLDLRLLVLTLSLENFHIEGRIQFDGGDRGDGSPRHDLDTGRQAKGTSPFLPRFFFLRPSLFVQPFSCSPSSSIG